MDHYINYINRHTQSQRHRSGAYPVHRQQQHTNSTTHTWNFSLAWFTSHQKQTADRPFLLIFHAETPNFSSLFFHSVPATVSICATIRTILRCSVWLAKMLSCFFVVCARSVAVQNRTTTNNRHFLCPCVCLLEYVLNAVL